VPDLIDAVNSFDNKIYKMSDCRENAERFSAQAFRKKLLDHVNTGLGE